CDLESSQIGHLQYEFADIAFRAGADVVDLARAALVQQLKVGLHNIAYIQEIPAHINVAHLQLRSLQSLAYTHQLMCHVGYQERLCLSRPYVVEWSGSENAPSGLGDQSMQTQMFSCKIAQRI